MSGGGSGQARRLIGDEDPHKSGVMVNGKTEALRTERVAWILNDQPSIELLTKCQEWPAWNKQDEGRL